MKRGITMKKRILSLILAGLCFALTACQTATSPVVGTWELTEKSIGTEREDLSEMSVFYTFYKNGTFKMKVNGMDAAEGTYTFENNILTWKVNELSGHMTYVNEVLLAEATVGDDFVVSMYSKVE
ncbi:MAG: hypothetical protein E7471_05025 [Ruminococcaceae bacterium]|nr:hypothetical protein [Oscillospiraceae bacterium]